MEPAADDTAFMPVDLSDPDAVLRAADEAVERLGVVDVLVNCAGVALPGRTIGLDLVAYHRTLAINLHAPVLLMRQFCGSMSRAGYGRVVNVSSVHARVSESASIAYDISKAGLEAATRTAALELTDRGVLVNAVAPDFVATRMSVVDGADELESEWFRTIFVENERLPLRRAARPEQVSTTITWPASDENSYITGSVVTVDGGLTARF